MRVNVFYYQDTLDRCNDCHVTKGAWREAETPAGIKAALDIVIEVAGHQSNKEQLRGALSALLNRTDWQHSYEVASAFARREIYGLLFKLNNS